MEISQQVFPWIEEEHAALIERQHANGLAKDIALHQFLACMLWFRRILIQDLAVIFTQNPHAAIFNFPPFNSSAFRKFAATSTAAIDAALEEARLAFQNLPQHLIASMEGALATQNLAFERERHAYQAQMRAMESQMGEMRSLLEVLAGAKRVKKTHGRSADLLR